MLKRIFVGSAMLFTLSMTATRASAALADCTTITLLSQLIADNAVGGCQHLDKIFNNFSYTGSSVSSVTAGHQYLAGGAGGSQDVHGWLFALSGGWTTGFTLSYDITVDLANFPLERIFQVKDQEQSGSNPNGTSLTDTETGTPFSITVLNINGGSSGCPAGSPGCNESSQKLISPLATSVHTSTVYTPGGGSLNSYEQDWFETAVSTVPEPASFVLMGLGLLGVAAFGRRRVKQQ
jgi:hypothetical protein